MLNINCWSALATVPTSASAGAKEAFNFTEFCCFSCFYNHRKPTSRHTRKLKFGIQAYFNLTRRNIKKNDFDSEQGRILRWSSGQKTQ